MAKSVLIAGAGDSVLRLPLTPERHIDWEDAQVSLDGENFKPVGDSVAPPPPCVFSGQISGFAATAQRPGIFLFAARPAGGEASDPVSRVYLAAQPGEAPLAAWAGNDDGLWDWGLQGLLMTRRDSETPTPAPVSGQRWLGFAPRRDWAPVAIPLALSRDPEKAHALGVALSLGAAGTVPDKTLMLAARTAWHEGCDFPWRRVIAPGASPGALLEALDSTMSAPDCRVWAWTCLAGCVTGGTPALVEALPSTGAIRRTALAALVRHQHVTLWPSLGASVFEELAGEATWPLLTALSAHRGSRPEREAECQRLRDHHGTTVAALQAAHGRLEAAPKRPLLTRGKRQKTESPRKLARAAVREAQSTEHAAAVALAAAEAALHEESSAEGALRQALAAHLESSIRPKHPMDVLFAAINRSQGREVEATLAWLASTPLHSRRPESALQGQWQRSNAVGLRPVHYAQAVGQAPMARLLAVYGFPSAPQDVRPPAPEYGGDSTTQAQWSAYRQSVGAKPTPVVCAIDPRPSGH